jgi:hypothetical protein
MIVALMVAASLMAASLMAASLIAPPAQPEPRRRDELTLDLVDPAAEGQHGVAFGLDVEPAGKLGGFAVGWIAVAPDDFLQ